MEAGGEEEAGVVFLEPSRSFLSRIERDLYYSDLLNLYLSPCDTCRAEARIFLNF